MNQQTELETVSSAIAPAFGNPYQGTCSLGSLPQTLSNRPDRDGSVHPILSAPVDFLGATKVAYVLLKAPFENGVGHRFIHQYWGKHNNNFLAERDLAYEPQHAHADSFPKAVAKALFNNKNKAMGQFYQDMAHICYVCDLNVFYVRVERGTGTPTDRVRSIFQYWEPHGHFLAEYDPINYNEGD